MKYIARKNMTGEGEPLREHLERTAVIAGQFAGAFGGEKWGYLCGLTHDIGKYSRAFQDRLLRDGAPCDHTTAAAVEWDYLGNAIMAYCVAGHHTGLPNGGSAGDPEGEQTLVGRLKKKDLPDYSAYRNEIEWKKIAKDLTLPIKWGENRGFTFMFFIRMLFSCLVDADFLEIEHFLMQKCPIEEENHILNMMVLYQNFTKKLSEREGLQEKRGIAPQMIGRTEQMLFESFCSKRPRGIFTLTVPTESRKVAVTLGFALEHAKQNKLSRIFYLLPYTATVEWTVQEIRSWVGEDAVLEYYGDIELEGEEAAVDPLHQRMKVIVEDWNATIVVTTSTRFFESLFANSTVSCRKLHRIADSLIVLEEAQIFPLPYLSPCLAALTELVTNYQCSVLLCTALQPEVTALLPERITCTHLRGKSKMSERTLRHISLRDLGQMENSELASRIERMHQVLCVLNTRRHAKRIYELIEQTGSFYLSTMMYPRHRERTVERVRERLASGDCCRLVATALVESQEGIMFPEVYRAWSGIGSLAQIAGRCSCEETEGRKSSVLFLFEPEHIYTLGLHPTMRKSMVLAREITAEFGSPFTAEATRSYFERLYADRQALDEKKILERLSRTRTLFPFADIAAEVKFVTEETCIVLIPLEKEAQALAGRLLRGERSRALIRLIMRYSVQTSEAHLQVLVAAGAVQLIEERLAVLWATEYYSEMMGLQLEPEPVTGQDPIL